VHRESLTLALLALPVLANAASFTPLGQLPSGSTASVARGLSADGTVVVGYAELPQAGQEAFRWTAATGMVGLGRLGQSYSVANGVSADGSIIVGKTGRPQPGNDYEAFRWTVATGMVGLGDLPGGAFNSGANAVSADGSTIVGFGNVGSLGLVGDFDAAYWSDDGLDPILGGLEAFGVSANGQVIVGRTDENVQTAFRWAAENGLVSLGFLPGGTSSSYAYGVQLMAR
jgi:probable HAF family extracellular repeat protein